VGIREVAEKIWLVSFMTYDFGFLDHKTGRVECAENPFAAKVLPMSPVQIVTDVPGTDKRINGRGEGICRVPVVSLDARLK
jgi:hypothetical protein